MMKVSVSMIIYKKNSQHFKYPEMFYMTCEFISEHAVFITIVNCKQIN